MARKIDNRIVQKPLFEGQFFTSGTIVENLSTLAPKKQEIKFLEF